MSAPSKPMKLATILAQVNAAIAKAGGKERLVYASVGGTYFYFENVGERGAPSEPINVADGSGYTVERWLDELRTARMLEALNPREDFCPR